MHDTICGVDCGKCPLRQDCGGCAESGGRHFGGDCVLARCCHEQGYARCGACQPLTCQLKQRLIAEFNALGVEDMPQLTELNALRGSFVNLEYMLANGHSVKLLDDDKIYLGNQLRKGNGARCYGLAADAEHLLVCEYGAEGADAEIVVYKRR